MKLDISNKMHYTMKLIYDICNNTETFGKKVYKKIHEKISDKGLNAFIQVKTI